MSLDLDSIPTPDSSHTPLDMARDSFTSNSKRDPTVGYSHRDWLSCANVCVFKQFTMVNHCAQSTTAAGCHTLWPPCDFLLFVCVCVGGRWSIFDTAVCEDSLLAGGLTPSQHPL